MFSQAGVRTTIRRTLHSGAVAESPSERDWFRYGRDRINPMSLYAPEHDTAARTILGGHVIPSGTAGRQRLEQALDVIAVHPNVGPFMAKHLIQKFVTSNPSPGYISRVAGVFNDDGNGTRGNLGATLKAVLLDYEARDPAPRESFSYGKSSEPLLRMARLFRVIPGTLPRSEFGDPNYYFNFQYTLPGAGPPAIPVGVQFFPTRLFESRPGRPQRAVIAGVPDLRGDECPAPGESLIRSVHWGVYTVDPSDRPQ